MRYHYILLCIFEYRIRGGQVQGFQEVINIILSTMLRYCPCYRQANAIGIIEMDWLATQSIQIRHFAGMQWIVHLYVIPADQKKKVHTICKALSLNNVEYPSLARCDQ